ncbi:MAG: hypothetical protein PUC73_06620 [Lachnospiraceae bacterium]|nr:hypothetical protein [Lachnospiraceae bacterium]
MARVVLCAGSRSRVPLRLQTVDRELYSAEEICYYLYHHAITAEDYITQDVLAEYYETELGLPLVAERLRVLKASEAAVREYAMVVFGATAMYTEEETAEYLRELERLQDLRFWQKQKAKADVYLEHRKYRDAMQLYERLLRKRKELEMPEVATGNVYHNLAICELHITGAGSAAGHFAEAYEKNRSQESLRSYLIALRLAQKDNEYLTALEQYEVSEFMKTEMDAMLFECMVEAGESPEYQELVRIKKLFSEGQLPEYQEATRELLESFKKQYRQDNM